MSRGGTGAWPQLLLQRLPDSRYRAPNHPPPPRIVIGHAEHQRHDRQGYRQWDGSTHVSVLLLLEVQLLVAPSEED